MAPGIFVPSPGVDPGPKAVEAWSTDDGTSRQSPSIRGFYSRDILDSALSPPVVQGRGRLRRQAAEGKCAAAAGAVEAPGELRG